MNQEDLKLDEKRQQSDTMMVQMLELQVKNFKALITNAQANITNIFETNGKIENFIKEIEYVKMNQMAIL